MSTATEKRRKHPIIKIFLFLLLAALLFLTASRVLERKTFHGSWNYMAKINEFYDMEEDSLNYIGVGSSHLYCDVNPLEIWKDSGIPGFLLSTQQQPLTASYYYLKEAFKTQSPDLVFVEAFMAAASDPYPSAEVAYDAVDPLPFSLNKLQMIHHITPPQEWPNYYFNILKYHSNWKENKNLTKKALKEAFFEPKDSYKGFVCLEKSQKFSGSEINYPALSQGTLSEQNITALTKIREICDKHGSQMILLVTPFDSSEIERAEKIKAAIAWAEENHVTVINTTVLYEELGLDRTTDFFDASGHLNAGGARKISLYLSQYMKDHNILPRANTDTEKWKNDYRFYRNSLKHTVFPE